MFNIKKSKIVCIIMLIIILILVFIDYQYILKPIYSRKKFFNESIELSERNKENIFRISKIIKYSSAEAVDNTVEQNLQDLSIHQYSDIAIYIDSEGEDLTEKNTVKELYIDNFKIDVGYNFGKPTLYYKNPLEISKFRIIDENEIKDVLNYEIVNTNKENQENDYKKPKFFADCSNPITIGFVNKNIINNYQVTKENSLVAFDGRILKSLDMDLNKLSPKISFRINIKNNLDEKYVCEASAKLDLKTEDGSVESGYIIEILDDIKYYQFFKQV